MQKIEYDLPVFNDKDVADLNEYSQLVANALKVQIDKFGQPLTFKGTVDTMTDLQNIQTKTNGDIYEVKDIEQLYIYNGNEWVIYSDTLKIKIEGFDVIKVETLPTENIQEKTIYLVPNTQSKENNVYDEYIYVNSTWEIIGSTAVDLSNYYNKEEVDNKVANIQALPVGGTTGQVLTKQSDTDGDASWQDSGDTLPIGSIVDYEGDTVPEGWSSKDGYLVANTTIQPTSKNIANTLEYVKRDGETNYTKLSNGYRVINVYEGKSDGYRWICLKSIDVSDYVGQTVTLNCNINKNGVNTSRILLSLCDDDNNTINISSSISDNYVSVTIPEITTKKYLAVYFYASVAETTAQANSYIDYTDITLRIGDETRAIIPDDYGNIIISTTKNGVTNSYKVISKELQANDIINNEKVKYISSGEEYKLDETSKENFENVISDILNDYSVLNFTVKVNKIKKTYQGTIPENKILNTESKSQTDTYSCDYINNLNVYSTEETVIGKWIDGKPLYRKVLKALDITTVQGTNRKDWDLTSLHISEIINPIGFVQLWQPSMNAYQRLDVNGWSNTQEDFHQSFEMTSAEVSMKTKVNFYLILEYTKTTDTGEV